MCKYIERGMYMKNIVEAKDLTFEYLIHDDQGEVEDTIIALDHIWTQWFW